MTDVSEHSEVKMGSERGFAIVFAIVFLVIGLWAMLFHGGAPRYWALVVGAIFLGLGFLAPDLLKPLNRVWFRFGLLLGKIIAPIVMGIIFFVTVTPIGMIRRFRQPDPLGTTPDPEVDSYWVAREPAENASMSMRKQF